MRIHLKSDAIFALSSLVILLLISGVSAQDDEIIKVDSSLVVLNASITNDNGEPLHNLTKSDFTVLENGKPQELAFVESHDTPYAVIILIDTSGSMEQRVSVARSAAINFLSGIRQDDSVAIFNFDSKVRLVQEFSNLRDLKPNAFRLKASGMTVLNDAIYKAASELKSRKEKRKAIVVLSDGADTRSGRSAKKALNAALATDATIYTVDMSNMGARRASRHQNQAVLKRFAKRTGGKFIATPGGREMRQAFSAIVEDLGVQYTLGYYPTNTKRDGKWRKIELKIKSDKKVLIRTREGYNAPK